MGKKAQTSGKAGEGAVGAPESPSMVAAASPAPPAGAAEAAGPAAPPLPPPPPAAPPLPPPLGPAHQLENYFSFRTLLTTRVMEILSPVGHIVITAVAICLLCFAIPQWSRPWPWSGLALLILGNLVWRLVCEVVVLLYLIHDRLASIDDKLKRQ